MQKTIFRDVKIMINITAFPEIPMAIVCIFHETMIQVSLKG
jgi:hypothetical protein